MNPPRPAHQSEYDPTYLNSLREAKMIIFLFAVFCAWAVLACYLFGYGDPPAAGTEIAKVLGMPSWIFWGICLPWIAVDVVAVWFCFFYMQVDDLGENDTEEHSSPATEAGKEVRGE